MIGGDRMSTFFLIWLIGALLMFIGITSAGFRKEIEGFNSSHIFGAFLLSILWPGVIILSVIAVLWGRKNVDDK